MSWVSSCRSGVGREDNRSIRLRGVVQRDSSEAMIGTCVLMDAALLLEQFGRNTCSVASQSVDGLANFFGMARLAKLDSGGLGYVMGELFSQRLGVVGVNTSVFRGARDGNVGEPGVDEAASRIGVNVGENAVCRKSLRAVRGHDVAVLEIPHLLRIKGHRALFFAVQPHADLSWFHVGDRSEAPVGYSKAFIGRRELDAVAGGELA